MPTADSLIEYARAQRHSDGYISDMLGYSGKNGPRDICSVLEGRAFNIPDRLGKLETELARLSRNGSTTRRSYYSFYSASSRPSPSPLSPPHRCLLNPVFIQRIHRFTTTDFVRTSELSSVHSSWHETQKHHHGAYYCWKNNFFCTNHKYAESRLERFYQKVLLDLVCIPKCSSKEPLVSVAREGSHPLQLFFQVSCEMTETDTAAALKKVLEDGCKSFLPDRVSVEKYSLLRHACRNPDIDPRVVQILLDMMRQLGGREQFREQLFQFEETGDHKGLSTLMVACAIPANVATLSCIFKEIEEYDSALLAPSPNNEDANSSSSSSSSTGEVDDTNNADGGENTTDDENNSNLLPLFEDAMTFTGSIEKEKREGAMIPLLHACRSSDSQTVEFLLDRIEEFVRKMITLTDDKSAKSKFLEAQVCARSNHGTSLLQFLCVNGKIKAHTIHRVCSRLVDCGKFKEEYDYAIKREKYCAVNLSRLGVIAAFSTSFENFIKLVR